MIVSQPVLACQSRGFHDRSPSIPRVGERQLPIRGQAHAFDAAHTRPLRHIYIQARAFEVPLLSRPADPLTLPNAARPAPMEVQSCQFPGGAAGVVRSACFAFDTKNGAKAADRHWFKQEFCASVAYLEAWLAKQDALPAGEGFAPELPPMMAL